MKKPNNILVKHYAGSIAYGTNLPTSDVDFRGIYCDPPQGIITPWSRPRSEQWEDPTEEDTVLTELHKYMSGYVNGSPNVLESLWVDKSDIIQGSEVYDYLRSNAQALLSKKLRWSFGGYALGQLKRIKGHNKWINNPQPEASPVRGDYFKLIQNFTMDKVFNNNFDIRRYNEGCILVPYGNNIFGIINNYGGRIFNDDGSIRKVDYEALPDHVKKDRPLFIVKLNEEVYKADKELHGNYWTWKRERNEVRAKLERDHGYDCYSADTEFLTESGWKLFDDISDEKLATFNSDHEVEYHKPIARIDKLYSGDMHHFTGYHQNTLVTANHHMHIRPYSRNKKVPSGDWSGVAACQLPETYEILNVIKPLTTVCGNPDVNTVGMELDIYLQLMGWYISDGTMTFYKDRPKDLRILCYSKKSAVYQNLIKFGNSNLLNYTLDSREYKDGKYEYSFRFGRDVAEALYADCGHKSREKRLSKWVYGLTQDMKSVLLDAILKGDAYKRPRAKGIYAYYTINSMLADDVQILALLMGYKSTKYGPYNHTNPFTDHCKMYHVHVDLLPKETHVNVGSNRNVISVEGKRVVCFELPNNTVITRRSGKVSLHRQCKHAMHIVRLLRMGEEVLRDGVVNVKRPDAKELLAIRAGDWKYEELLEWAEDQDNKLDKLFKTSQLPPKVDLNLATEVLINAEKMANESRG